MLFSSSVLTLTFLSGIVTSLPHISPNACIGNKSTPVACTNITYIDTTHLPPNATAPPALVSDCLQTCTSIQQDLGGWKIDLSGLTPGDINTVLNFPCKFSIGRGEGEPDNEAFWMDNQDFLNILDEVVRRFGEDGKVAAMGTMVCEGRRAEWYVGAEKPDDEVSPPEDPPRV
jgi:hypothetical protein